MLADITGQFILWGTLAMLAYPWGEVAWKGIMKYITKDSGKRQVYETGMQRDVNDGKVNHCFLIYQGVPYEEQMLSRWAALMTRGAEKYTPRNHEKAATQEELDRFQESAYRHFMQWLCGETDEDHASAVLFNISSYEMTKWKMEHAPAEQA
jgi:dATP/dGTP diphosphohydrolase, N-terminal